MSSGPESSVQTSAVSRVVAAALALRGALILPILDDAVQRLGLDTTVDEVVFPALHVVGASWAAGTSDPVQGLCLSNAVGRWIGSRLHQELVRRRGCILLAAGPEDLHTAGLDCLELLLASRGVDVCNLGAQVPSASLLTAARATHAAAVVIYSHQPTAASQAVQAVRIVSAEGFSCYYAGSSFQSAFVRTQLPGEPLDAPLGRAAALLTRLHTSEDD